MVSLGERKWEGLNRIADVVSPSDSTFLTVWFGLSSFFPSFSVPLFMCVALLLSLFSQWVCLLITVSHLDVVVVDDDDIVAITRSNWTRRPNLLFCCSGDAACGMKW